MSSQNTTAQHSETTIMGAGSMQLYCQSWRPAAGKIRGVMAIVHGFGEHSGRYGYLVDALTGAGYAVWGFDHRGHGRSPGLRGHVDQWDEFIADVASLVQHARAAAGGDPVFLFGHSLGGLIALNYALRRPEGLRGVIASAPLLAQANVSPLLRYTAKVMANVRPTFGLDTKLDAGTIAREAAEVERYRSDVLVHSRATARFGVELEKAVNWTQAHAAELRAPLLIYHGSGDRLVPIEGSRAFFQHVTLADKEWVEWEDGYHESHNDLHREAVFALIVGWLDRHNH